SARAFGVALAPPEDGAAPLVVVLPLACTYEAGGMQRLASSDLGERLAQTFQRLQQDQPRPFYYLACVPEGKEDLKPALALAATGLGWPGGHCVLLPTPRPEAVAALVEGLDRLRWLFAGALELVVLNQEPAADEALAAAVQPAEDRARVARFFGTGDDPDL